MTGHHHLPSCDDSAETSHVLAGHLLDECRRIEGRIESLRLISDTLGVQGDDPSPVDVALAVARQSIRTAGAEALRFIRCQMIGLRDPLAVLDELGGD